MGRVRLATREPIDLSEYMHVNKNNYARVIIHSSTIELFNPRHKVRIVACRSLSLNSKGFHPLNPRVACIATYRRQKE